MKNSIRTFIAATAVAASTSAFAATDGTSGASSTGTSLITLTLSKLISVAGLEDMTLDFANGYADSTEFCVGQSGGVSNYDVTLSSANPSGTNEFRLADGGATNFVIYNVSYTHDNDSGTAGVQGTATQASASGSPLGTFGNGASDVALGTLDCSAENIARIDVAIADGQLSVADASGSTSFTDTLTVTVQAN